MAQCDDRSNIKRDGEGSIKHNNNKNKNSTLADSGVCEKGQKTKNGVDDYVVQLLIHKSSKSKGTCVIDQANQLHVLRLPIRNTDANKTKWGQNTF